ncbi:hypothetical protein [Quadrisphaera setariae]|uniref:Uncharacterized protein n=1 Tax=Quadrisphaera setariae TaxID=2593304 RepID=A0A5C8ZJF6_9ACTN|nr:hypothetical protein [Quadrisphaera setariae]TXR58022.1 hypothetical protein FMM08_02035 [Quadrisphaera setariae]
MTTTKPAVQPAQAQPGRGGGRSRRRRPQRAASTWESRSDARSLDPDATTGPVSGVLGLLVGVLEVLGALFSWTGGSDG